MAADFFDLSVTLQCHVFVELTRATGFYQTTHRVVGGYLCFMTSRLVKVVQEVSELAEVLRLQEHKNEKEK